MFKYSKYEGLGNDFIICQDKDINNKEYSKIAINLCNSPAIGKTDGFISVKTNPLTMIFYNQDGSVGTMCGNGLRCFIKYCYDNKIINNLENEVYTKAGIYKTKIISTDPFLVKVRMGNESYSNDILKIKTDKNEFINEIIKFNNKDYKLTSLFMGTHHTVIFVDSLEELTEELGYFMCHLPIFEDRTNVDFVVVKNEHELHVKTYERGVGYTLACGTGACASFAVARRFNLCSDNVKVIFEKGSLKISYDQSSIWMEGPCEFIKSYEEKIN